MAYSPLGNPAAPPTRKWEEDSVPLIQGKQNILCTTGILVFRSCISKAWQKVQQELGANSHSLCSGSRTDCNSKISNAIKTC